MRKIFDISAAVFYILILIGGYLMFWTLWKNDPSFFNGFALSFFGVFYTFLAISAIKGIFKK
uniref:Uncharacterized protein n=1 Tax=Ochrobactrum phage ORM_20 TaxID=2985243 RepID=A0A9N6ZEZ4_9VIRU|nr:hypothetical protein ORM20_00051 [Ochrobactrum phage ORM_20]